MRWVGLDGTEVPLYLHRITPGASMKDIMATEAMTGLLHWPPILVESPDLIEVDDAWIEDHAEADLVLLDEALPQRLERHPPRSRARFYSQWSYIEGIRAEELLRSNCEAEASALRAESLSAVAMALVGWQPESTREIWKTILSTQHHDAYCFCAPELKAKCIGWLKEARGAADLIAKRAAHAVVAGTRIPAGEGSPFICFNAAPCPTRSVVTAPCEGEGAVVEDVSGRRVPADCFTDHDGQRKVRFVADFPGLGYSLFRVRKTGETTSVEAVTVPVSFQNRFYAATVSPDGTFLSLALPSGERLLQEPPGGHSLRAEDSTGLGVRRPAGAPQENWQPPRHGPQLSWEPGKPSRVRRSPLGVTLEAAGRMGPRVTAEFAVTFYNELPRIDLQWKFIFAAASIGTFYDDETKLRVLWPLAFRGAIHHDIAFGVVSTAEERPFVPASWVDVSDGTKGLAYFHLGTGKHWVRDDVLVNLFAWGEETEAIGSRMWRQNWLKCFDQRLTGSHTIRAALLPHAGDWRSAHIVTAARGFGAEPLSIPCGAQDGHLPPAETILSMRSPGACVTAVFPSESELRCRMYNAGPGLLAPRYAAKRFSRGQLFSLKGERLKSLRPFQIGEMRLTAQPPRT